MKNFDEVESLGKIASKFELLAANETLSPACRERNKELARQYRKAQENELIRLANVASVTEAA